MQIKRDISIVLQTLCSIYHKILLGTDFDTFKNLYHIKLIVDIY